MIVSGENNLILQRARDLWSAGQGLDAGRLIFEILPNDIRPKWAARILRLVLDRSGIDPAPFAQVLYDADHQALWRDGHSAFSKLRNATLKLDKMRSKHGLSDEQQEILWVLALAELVAKVTYNATNPRDKFDEDSGWWIADCLRGFVDWWHDDDFSTAAWSALRADV